MNETQSDFMSDLDSIDTAINTIVRPDKTDGKSVLLQELSASFVYKNAQKVPRNLDAKKLILNPVETFSIKYVLTDAQLAKMEEEAPYRRFRYEPVKPHDHPVSHIWYTLNESVILETFKGQKYVDLHGRATRNPHLKTNAVIYRGRYNTRDYMRWTEDGATVKDLISVEWAVKQNPGVKYWFSNHSAYYMSLEDIATIVYSSAQAEFHAIVHRHDRLKGTINGELDYIVDENGYVNQFTPLGEKYHHPTFEPYFHQHEAKTSKGVITWTTNKMGGESYHVKFVAAPGYHGEVEEMKLPDLSSKAKPVIKIETPDYQVKSVFGYEWITFTDNKSVVLDNMPLFDRLCKFIANKDRNETTMKDLALYARRLTDKNDLFAKHSHEWYDIPHEHMVWYVQAAFYADIQNEIAAMLHFRRQSRKEVTLHQELKNSITARDTTISDRVNDVVDAAVTASTQTLRSVSKLGKVTGATLAGEFLVSGLAKMPAVTMSQTLLREIERDIQRGSKAPDKRPDPRALISGLAAR